MDASRFLEYFQNRKKTFFSELLTVRNVKKWWFTYPFVMVKGSPMYEEKIEFFALSKWAEDILAFDYQL